MMNKKIYLGILVLVMGILISGSVMAFAVSCQYWKGNPITLYPGQTKDVSVILQNIAGTEDISVRAELLEGSAVAEMIDESNIYSVPLGETTPINLRLTYPTESELGEEYELILTFTTIVEGGDGPLGIGSGVQKEIPVIIVEEPKPVREGLSWWAYLLIALAVVLLIVMISLVLKKKKKKETKSKK